MVTFPTTNLFTPAPKKSYRSIMETNTWNAHPTVRGFLFLLLVCSAAVTVVAAAGPGNVSMTIAQGPDLNVTNHSFTDTEILKNYAATPTPITIIKAELTAETLSGPRYMAFGPSSIGISIDPRLLAVCFAIVLVCIVAWFIVMRKRGEDAEAPAERTDEERKD